MQLIPTNQVPELGYEFENLNPFQSQFFPYRETDCNCVVSAGTGSGKTVVAELCINEALKKGDRAIFIGPMRALAKEKFDDWTEEGHPFNEKGVSILTGDFKLTNAKKKELDESKVVLMTSEMLDSRSRRMKAEGNKWLLETTVCVVDEAHLIGMIDPGQQALDTRGHKLEAALIRFMSINPNCRIVLLSATLPNLPELGDWLTKLNNKRTEIIVSDWAPQEVEWHMETYYQEIGRGSYHVNKDKMFQTALETYSKHTEDMWLIFCHSKNDGRKMQAKMSNAYGIEVPFHSADLNKEDRHRIEELFKKREQKVLISTSTVAYGMNMPARRVMILDTKRGLTPVHPYDIKQMGGRAGRIGIDPCGDVHIICGDNECDALAERLENLPEAESLMNDIDTFAFHVVAEIAEGSIKNREDVMAYYEKTLAAHQGMEVSEHWMNELIDKLIKCKAIEEQSNNLKIKKLGLISSWMYFSPFDIYHWYCNFNMLFHREEINDAQIAWAWTSIRSNSMDYIPRGMENVVEDYEYNIANIGPTRLTSALAAGIYQQIKGEKVAPQIISGVRNLLFDVERHAQTILMIEKMVGCWGRTNLIKQIATRVAYGVGWNEAKLCLLPKIGKTRAKKLCDNGIMTYEDFIENKKKCIELIGEKTYKEARKGIVEATNPQTPY